MSSLCFYDMSPEEQEHYILDKIKRKQWAYGASIKDIASLLDYSKVLPVLTRLLNKGLIERVNNPDDTFTLHFKLKNPDPKKCIHKISGNQSIHYKEQKPQITAFRIESTPILNRCSQKYPSRYNSFNEERIANLIITDIHNGYILNYGLCDVNNCPDYCPNSI